MSLVQQFLKSFRESDDLKAGLFEKNDGTVWLRNPDGSETQLPGAGFPPIWVDLLSGASIDNGTIDFGNSYCIGLQQPAAPAGLFPSVTGIWTRIVYATYTGGGEPGALSIPLDPGSAAIDENHHDETGEIVGYWATGGIGGGGQTFGGAYWSAVDGTVNVEGTPVFSGPGDILLCGMGIFPSL